MGARDVYTAIAGSTRREILQLLLSQCEVSAGTIASRYQHISRPAISKHLRILRECGVVVSYKEGKTQKYLINPAPLKELQQGWLAQFAEKQIDSLTKLRVCGK